MSSGNFARVTPGLDSFANIPDGMAGIETMIRVVFSEGVRGGHLSLNQGVKLTSTNSARLFGLYPQTGTIAVASDADLAINPYPQGAHKRGTERRRRKGPFSKAPSPRKFPCRTQKA